MATCRLAWMSYVARILCVVLVRMCGKCDLWYFAASLKWIAVGVRALINNYISPFYVNVIMHPCSTPNSAYLFTGPERVLGVDSFSDNLAEHRPAWFGGSEAHHPAIYITDGNHSTCIFLPGGNRESLVVDLGFHVNATLHGEIVVDGVYHILHSCVRY